MNIYKVPYLDKIDKEARFTVKVPGSKSITNRALLLAAMSEGTSVLTGCMFSEDSEYFIECLKTLGFPVEIVSEKKSGADIVDNKTVKISGFGGKIPVPEAEIYVGSAGTAARFLLAMLAFSDGKYKIDSSEQMRKRPMDALIATLREAGAEIICTGEEGHFPMTIKGVADRNSLPAELSVDISKSSQFLSALLIAAGSLKKDIRIRINGNHGLAYVDMTVEMMKSFGVRCFKSTAKSSFGDRQIEKISYLVKASKGSYRASGYAVEPDASAAAYFYAFAALTGTEAEVEGVKKPSLQGDLAFLKVLKAMGCEIGEYSGSEAKSCAEQSDENKTGQAQEETNVLRTEKSAESIINGLFEEKEDSVRKITVKGPAEGLKGDISVDMSAFSDQALTLAAIAPFCDGEIKITGISHIRGQECDRINAIVKNLSALGVKTELCDNDDIIIYPAEKMQPADIETFEDHRVAMAFALTGLLVEGTGIINPGCCKKTFKEYFEVLDSVIKKVSCIS